MRRVCLVVLLGTATAGLEACGGVGMRAADATTRDDASEPDSRFDPILRPASDYGAFPARIEWDGAPLVLNGAGLCEWGFLAIDLYRAALYLDAARSDLDSILASGSRVVLHLHFLRELTREQLVEAYRASVRVNAGSELPRYAAALDGFCATLARVDAGDGLTFVVEPEGRLEVFRNGEPRGVVEDAAFASLFVRLYLGEKPPTGSLKDALLGGD